MTKYEEMVDSFAGIKYGEEFIRNSRGVKLFTCRWLPACQELKALVFLCHGYSMETSVFMKDTGVRLAQAGYAVFGIDYEGHGKSEGLWSYIENFQNLVDDCQSFSEIERGVQKQGQFLYGESMGGAVALRIHRKEPHEWNGAVLVAPMCKISEKLKPPAIVVNILKKLANYIPTWKIVPTKNVIDSAFKDLLKREEIRANPYIYQDRPRLKTAAELLDVSSDLEKRLDEVTLPFLVVHGEDDQVNDPQCSKELYEKANSFDKELILYPGMWHGLTSGEPDENIDLVFRDIIQWLNKRCPAGNASNTSQLRHSDVSAVITSPNATLPVKCVAKPSELESKIEQDGKFMLAR